MATLLDELRSTVPTPPTVKKKSLVDELRGTTKTLADELQQSEPVSWEPAPVEMPKLKPFGDEGKGGSATDQSKWTGPRPTREPSIVRGAKQFANALIPQSVKYFMASGKMLERASKTDPALANIYSKIDRKEPLTDEEKVVKAQKENELLSKLQYDEGAVQEFAPESLKVDAPIGIGEKLTDVGAGLGAFLTHLLVAKKLVPPGTVISPKLANAVAFEMAGQAEGQPGGHGLVMGSVLNQTARIPSTVLRTATEAGIFGGLTAAEGGNLEDVLISAGIPVALAGVHSALSWEGFSKQYPGFALKLSKRVETDRDLSHSRAREEALTAAKNYKANPDDPAAQAEWRRVTEKYGGYGSLKPTTPEPLTPEQQTTVKTNLAELQAQADAAKPPAPLTPEQRVEVRKNLAELQANVAPAPPAEMPAKPPTLLQELESTRTPAQTTPEGVLKATIKPQQFEGVPTVPESAVEPIQPKATPAEAQGPIAPASGPTAAGAQPPAPAPVPDEKPWTISSRNVDLDEHAKRMGLDGVNSKEKQTFKGWLAEARKQGIPERALDLATEINTTKRITTDVENAGLLDRMAQSSLEFDRLQKRLSETSDPAERMSLNADMSRTRSEFESLKNASQTGRREAARSLVSSKMTLDENRNLISILSEAEASRGPNGKPLSEGDRQKYANLVDQLNKATEDIQAMQTKIADMEALFNTKDGGRRRYGRMTPEARLAERKSLTDQVRALLKAGCY